MTSLSTSTDLFIAKYAADGTFQWVSHAGGGGLSSNHWAFSIDTVPDGSCVTTGYIRDGCTFGSGEVNETTLAVAGNVVNPFVARYDATGMLLWARNASCASHTNGTAIAAFDDGSCVITGRLGNTPVTFGPGELGETTLASNGQYAARYAPDGGLAWAKAMESLAPFHQTSSIAAMPDDSVVIAGRAEDDTVLGVGEPSETALPPGSVVARLRPDGSLAWARSDPGSAAASTVSSVPGGAYAWSGSTRFGFDSDLVFEDGTVLPAQPGMRAAYIAVRAND